MQIQGYQDGRASFAPCMMTDWSFGPDEQAKGARSVLYQRQCSARKRVPLTNRRTKVLSDKYIMFGAGVRQKAARKDSEL